MPCQTDSTPYNPYAYYNQCTGVTPQWYVVNNGCNSLCGCIPIVAPCAPRHRRYSPYCKLITVTPAAPQIYLQVAASPPTDSQSLTFSHSRVQMEIFRKGCWTLITTYNAWRRDENGYIGFYFDDTLFNEPHGYYVGDVFIDCVYCFSVTLRLPPCEAYVTDCYAQPALQTCDQGICSVEVPAGFGVVGGLFCTLPQPPSTCGTIAPFFPITNPPPPVPVCGTGSTCCYVPATSAGSVRAGG